MYFADFVAVVWLELFVDDCFDLVVFDVYCSAHVAVAVDSAVGDGFVNNSVDHDDGCLVVAACNYFGHADGIYGHGSYFVIDAVWT